MAASTVEMTRRDGGTTVVDLNELSSLRRRLDGSVLLPGASGWDEATSTWNAMVAKTPAAVVQPSSPTDVAETVSFARDHDILLSVRGAGHNIAGTSIAQGGLALDMSRMRSVAVDPQAHVADVEPGCTLGDVDRATQLHGLATVMGFVSETGVAGLTLGGGWGYLTRRFGWSVDNLREVQIVTADGQVRTANRTHNEDLFWALRGGSGNFGIVTRFTFRLHAVGPMIIGGLKVFDAQRADEILSFYQELTAHAPRELTTAVVARLAPPAPFLPQAWHGKPIVSLLVCYSGTEADTVLAPIRALEGAVATTISSMPYVALQSMLNAMEPRGLHRYWKTEFLPELSPGFLKAFGDGALRVASPLSQSLTFHIGGALNEHEADDGAVGNRDAHYITGFAGTWPANAPAAPHIDWVRTSWEAIREYSTGGNYVNFQLADDDEHRLEAAYRENFERLRQVKAKYDPSNLFRVNRNIRPAD